MRKLLQHEMEHLAQEQVRVLLLNRRNRLLGQRVIYHGNLYSCMVRAAEVYRPAVIESVPAIIMVHNHPSGLPEPSPEDIAITQTVVEAGNLLDIELLDHVVIGSRTSSASRSGASYPGSCEGSPEALHLSTLVTPVFASQVPT